MHIHEAERKETPAVVAAAAAARRHLFPSRHTTGCMYAHLSPVSLQSPLSVSLKTSTG